MPGRITFLSFLAAATMTAAAVSGCGGRSDDGGEVFTDPAAPIDVGVGDQFTIALEATPSTGYSWELTQPMDTAVVESEGSDHEQGDDSAPGAPGTQSFRFRATGTGTATIALQYVRPWETDVAPAKTAEFNVAVSA